MKQTPQSIILQALEIIGYTDNKEQFSNKFFQLCKQQAVIELVKSFPEDKQKALEAEIDKFLLKKYFSEEQISQALEKATQQTFQSYLESIIPSLNDKQKSDLESFLKGLTEKTGLNP